MSFIIYMWRFIISIKDTLYALYTYKNVSPEIDNLNGTTY